MGMYDNLSCAVPLPDGYTGGGFQTKDLDCILARVEIRADGTLWIERFNQEVVPETERPYPNETGILALVGMLRSVNVRWEQVRLHGILNFYAGDATTWHEYDAKFTDGKLVSIAVASQLEGEHA